MRFWLRGKFVSLVVYGAITALVAGGLGWVTLDALRLEKEKREERGDAQHLEKIRLALWRLDGRISPVLAREDSRPYNHFSAVYAPSLALQPNGMACSAGAVLELSPLVGAELPDWIALHFQTGEAAWSSPQVTSPELCRRLDAVLDEAAKKPAPERLAAIQDLSAHLKSATLIERLREFEEAAGRPEGDPLRQENTTLVYAGQQAMNPLNQPPGYLYKMQTANNNNEAAQQKLDQEFVKRGDQQNMVKQEVNVRGGTNKDSQAVATRNTHSNGENWFITNPRRVPHSERVPVELGVMVPLWVTGNDGRERLLVARRVRIGDRQLCQGLLLDWPRLQDHLAREVADLFPDARFVPVPDGVPTDNLARAMSALPVELDPGPRLMEVAPGWTPLRVGLALAWAAALVALLAVGLGGWTLLELSERRIRFVSAVTHELRTPLTTLRLYLDMLTGGMVQEEKQKAEYLQTLHAETERLNRLVGNVLDFSRLENQRPRLERSTISTSDLLEQVRSAWQTRCDGSEKLLIVDDRTAVETTLVTDVRLVPQILGNLIDNACKYSQGAADRRIWLRALKEGSKLVLEVEDRGPGVPPRERRSIFRAFRRGRDAETTGGVGLGLALARRWTSLLGGRLKLQPGAEGVGACFRLDLPMR